MKSYILKLQHDQKPLETSLEDKIINSLNHKCIFFQLLNHVNVEKDY